MSLLLLLAGCVDAAAPASVTEQAAPRLDPFVLRPGAADWHAILLVDHAGEHGITLSAPRGQGVRAAAQVYVPTGQGWEWLFGGMAGHGLGLQTDADAVLLVIALHAPNGTALTIETRVDDTPVAPVILQEGPMQLSFYEPGNSLFWPDGEHLVHGVEERRALPRLHAAIDAGPRILETRHIAQGPVLTWAFITVLPTAGGGAYEIDWTRFDTSSHAYGAAVSQAVGFAYIQSEVGDAGESTMRVEATEAAAFVGLILHHWTIPLTPEVEALGLLPRDDVGRGIGAPRDLVVIEP